MRYKHTMKYYSPIKKEYHSDTSYNMNESWTHYAKWKKSQKDRYYRIPLNEISRIGKFVATESRL